MLKTHKHELLVEGVKKVEFEYINCLSREEKNSDEYEEYFEYVTDETHLTPPKDWREGLDLYSHLIDLANHGS